MYNEKEPKIRKIEVVYKGRKLEVKRSEGYRANPIELIIKLNLLKEEAIDKESFLKEV